MSKVREYREMDKEIARLKKKMESLQSSEQFKKSLQFEEGLRELMRQHDFTARDVFNTLGVDLKQARQRR